MKVTHLVGLAFVCSCSLVVGQRLVSSAAKDLSNPQITPPTEGMTTEGLELPGKQVPGDVSCPSGMVHVLGDYCPNLQADCLEWMDPDTSPQANGGNGPLRCVRFSYPTQCLSANTIKKDYCIDKYEWPNKEGELPPIGMTYYEAQKMCNDVGKRLCNMSEATLACEGPSRKPYPYGYERDATACNIDQPSADPTTPRKDWSSVYRGVPSGSKPRCKSDFGVYDIVGNVDELVTNETGKPYKSALHGGYWGPVRTRCRPKTLVHNEGFSFYQIGFRCCADSKKANN